MASKVFFKVMSGAIRKVVPKGLTVTPRKTCINSVLAETIKTPKQQACTDNFIHIPHGKFTAPRAGFNETPQAHATIIRNNKHELRTMVEQYRNGLISKEELVNRYGKFLSREMDMPYYPELKSFSGDALEEGFFKPFDNEIWYNINTINEENLPRTINHEMHHFFQQKEEFLTSSIEDFSQRKAAKYVLDRIANGELHIKIGSKEFVTEVEKETQNYIRWYKQDAEWDKMLAYYTKNEAPSPYYNRGQRLIDADINYIDGHTNYNMYAENLLEDEAHHAGFCAQLEWDCSILERISSQEHDLGIKIYNILKSSVQSGNNHIKQSLFRYYNNYPTEITKHIRHYCNQGFNNAETILEKICSDAQIT